MGFINKFSNLNKVNFPFFKCAFLVFASKSVFQTFFERMTKVKVFTHYLKHGENIFPITDSVNVENNSVVSSETVSLEYRIF